VRQATSAPSDGRGVAFFEDSARTVLLVNGSADDSFSLSFHPEDGFNFSDYSVVRVVSNERVLNNASDVELMTTASPGGAVNVSATVDFHTFPGKTNLTVQFQRKDGTLFDSLTIEYLAAGLGIYRDDPERGRVLLSGTDRSFRIADYASNLKGKAHHELGAVVQFLNGSNSDSATRSNPAVDASSLFGLDSLVPVMMQYRGQVDWDGDVCRLSAATWDGASLLLPDGCGMGFASGAGGGPSAGGLHFGLDFEEYRAGSLDVLFEWDRFTEGTEFEDQQYTNYLKTRIGGFPPAVVRLVSPANDFSVDGGQDMYVEMINANGADVKSLTVAGASAPFLLRSGSYRQFSGEPGFYESAVFLTTPGTGKLLPWSIQATRENGTLDVVTGLPRVFPVQFIDQTGFLFSYDNGEVVLRGPPVPSHIPEDGGDDVALTGAFEAFNVSNPEHQVLFSNFPVSSRQLLAANGTHLTFTSPARADVGSAWSYDVSVRTGTDVSNSVQIRYIPKHMRLQTSVFGGSLARDADSVHEFGRCSNVTILATNELGDLDDVKFAWTLTAPDGTDVLALPNATDIVKTESMLTVDVDTIYLAGAVYNATVRAWNEYTSGASTTLIRRTNELRIGVTVIQPANRTKSFPETDLRIVAKVEFPRCFNDTPGLVYEWGWEEDGQDEAALFSNASVAYKKYQVLAVGENVTDGGNTGIIRLGREFIVPQPQIAAGLHRVYLWVFNPENRTSAEEEFRPLQDAESNSTMQGRSHAVAWIKESELEAVIRDGEVSITTDGRRDVEVSGARSFDPDAAAGDQKRGLSYAWTCTQAWSKDRSDEVACGGALMPVDSADDVGFTITSKTLLDASAAAKSPTGREAALYVQYNLIVTKGGRADGASQTVEVSKRSELAVQQLAESAAVRQATLGPLRPVQQSTPSAEGKIHERIDFTNAGGATVNPRRVKFWEELIITPVISPGLVLGTSWRFDLLEPAQEKNVFLISDRLLTQPGFYATGGGSAELFKAAPLGIKAGKLSPHQTYVFKIVFWYQREDGEQRESSVTISIKTVEYPKLVFPSLANAQGDVNTVFRASARTNVDLDAGFSYQFYLIDVDNPSVGEFCIDGCTGAPLALFKTYRSGRYRLEVRLLAANGKTVLDVLDNDRELLVSPAGAQPSVDQYKEGMSRDFTLGDDGSVNQRGFYFSNAMREDIAASQRSGVVALSDGREEMGMTCSRLAPAFVSSTLEVVAKEQPTTANVHNYIVLASNYARLSCLEGEDTLYNLLRIVDKTLERTPQDNTLQMTRFEGGTRAATMPDMDVVVEAQRFYNFTITRAISGLVARGSSRDRLAPVAGAVSNLLLDLYEKWREHMTTVSTSDQVCGFERTISAAVENGIVNEGLSHMNFGGRSSPFAPSQLKIAVRCNVEQGLVMTGNYSKFEWCADVYDAAGSQRKLISLAETYDYVYLSGIQGGNMTDSKRLVAVNITVLGEGNQLVSALSSKNDVLAQSESDADADTRGDSAMPASCYSISMEMHESAVRELHAEMSLVQAVAATTRRGAVSSTRASGAAGTSESCRFTVFTLWPTKKYGSNYVSPFQQNAYMRREDGLHEDERRSNVSHVTVQSGHLGLYGAVRQSCTAGLMGGAVDFTGTLASLIGLIAGILVMVLVVTGLTYMLATTLFAGAAGQLEEAAMAERYVERDFFGRGEVALQSRGDGDGARNETEGELEDERDMDLAAIEGGGGGGGGLDGAAEGKPTGGADEPQQASGSGDAPPPPPRPAQLG
jgi:REJ domain